MKKLYDNLKKGMPYVLTELQKNEVEILSILEKLGFPISQLGTYLYKDVIVEVCNIIDEGETTSNNKRRKLIARLNEYTYDYGRTKAKKLSNMNDISDQKLILK